MIYKNLTKIIKPFRLISLITTYALGAGLVQYVQEIRSWLVLFQGLFFLLMASFGFESLVLLMKVNNSESRQDTLSVEEKKQRRLSLALASATFLTISLILFVDWMVKGILWQGLSFLLLLLVVFAFLYIFSKTNPKVRLFQILFEAILFVILPPAFAYFLQSSDLHRLLSMVVFSLVPAYVAFRLLTQLMTHDRDQTASHDLLLMTLGWEQTMILHNALILLSFLLFALDALLGFPWFLLWPVFLTLPIGLLEIWLMDRIRRGGKPLWLVMQVSSASVFFLPMYLIGFAFWIR